MISRRHFCAGIAGAGLMVTTSGMSGGRFPGMSAWGQDHKPLIFRSVGSNNEELPLVGLGSWITFNVGRDRHALDQSAAVIDAFFKAGGRLIDSSPMYGSSQNTIGYGLDRSTHRQQLFAADKIWTSGRRSAEQQLAETHANWGVDRFDLLQIHNLVDWENHLEWLTDHKEQGKIGHIGITTSHGRRHGLVERILKNHPLDFLQLTYNAVDREAEARLLPLALEKGVHVIVNRPFRRGQLVRHVSGHPIPAWASSEADAQTWPQLLLKFIVSHPAVTTAIPATTRVDHVIENMGASYGRLPDARTRERIANHIRSL